ncbi:hypothetical protein MUU53_23015 [Rhizobium lemnae]|uniref:Uncharacterized protein n=1 Tax=Rhizobium lemnae TaxID=1214924 RepID=A0ABV8EE04_9HYPH|nr:hypothetical protein [Rhizobium lemnae]MCJ8510714.1 hypothetical protein [Rhizobium lemnae]
MNGYDEQARRDYERNNNARLREAHEFQNYHQQQAYNDRILRERQRDEEKRREEERRRSGW